MGFVDDFPDTLFLYSHPDKVKLAENQTIEEVSAFYVNLTKAYKSLTDDEIRSNLEKFGHPDGKQEFSMGLAVPTWVVASRNNFWVLGLYGLIFAGLLPMFVVRHQVPLNKLVISHKIRRAAGGLDLASTPKTVFSPPPLNYSSRMFEKKRHRATLYY